MDPPSYKPGYRYFLADSGFHMRISEIEAILFYSTTRTGNEIVYKDWNGKEFAFVTYPDCGPVIHLGKRSECQTLVLPLKTTLRLSTEYDPIFLHPVFPHLISCRQRFDTYR